MKEYECRNETHAGIVEPDGWCPMCAIYKLVKSMDASVSVDSITVFRCRCGGVIIYDDKSSTSSHEGKECEKVHGSPKD